MRASQGARAAPRRRGLMPWTAACMLCVATLACVDGLHTLRMVPDVVGLVSELQVNPYIELTLGARPGRLINMTLGSTSALPSSSCAYSSYCSRENASYTDYYYTSVYRGTLTYEVDASLSGPQVALVPDLWQPSQQSVALCPWQYGLLVDPTESDARRCFADPIVTRTWLPCAGSPFSCALTGAVRNRAGGNIASPTVRISLDDAHVRVPETLAVGSTLEIGELRIPLDDGARVEIDSVSRPLVVRENRSDVVVGTQSSRYAVWWRNENVCIGPAWDRSESLEFTGLVLWAFLMYVLRTWMLWSRHTERVIGAEMETESNTAGSFLLKLFHSIEVAGNVSAIVIVYVHTFSLDVQDRIFRISSLMTVTSSTWIMYLLLVTVSIQFFIWLIVRVEIVYKRTVLEYVIRRFCTVSNVLLSVCVLLIHNPVDHPTNLFLFGIGIAIMFRRHVDLLSRELRGIHFLFVMLYCAQIVFVTGVCFPPFIDMMRPLNEDTLTAVVLVSSMLVVLPMLHQYHIRPRLSYSL